MWNYSCSSSLSVAEIYVRIGGSTRYTVRAAAIRRFSNNLCDILVSNYIKIIFLNPIQTLSRLRNYIINFKLYHILYIVKNDKMNDIEIFAGKNGRYQSVKTPTAASLPHRLRENLL